MRRFFLNGFAFILIASCFLSCVTFGIREFWVVNKLNQDVKVELIFNEDSKKDITKIFAYGGFGDCSGSFPEGVVPTKDNGIVTLKSNQCFEIGLCESSSNQIDEILGEYEHNLKKINLHIGSNIKTIYPENFSKVFKRDGNNFYLTVE